MRGGKRVWLEAWIEVEPDASKPVEMHTVVLRLLDGQLVETNVRNIASILPPEAKGALEPENEAASKAVEGPVETKHVPEPEQKKVRRARNRG